MYQPRRIITVEEMRYLANHAKSPADLIELIPTLGIHLDFSEHLSQIWRKPFDAEDDLAALRKIQHRSDFIVEDFRNKGHDL